MKIRGVILATCALMVFWACYACANEPEPQQISSARPVMVPYLNKSINEVMQNEYEFVVDGDQPEADGDQLESVEDSDDYDIGAVLTNAGRMEEREDGNEDLDMRSDYSEPLPELVESEPDEPGTGGAEDPLLTYLGTYTSTAYCSCVACTTDGNGYTASGTIATEGRTVACNCLPIGTEVMIEGHTYIVEDTGWTPYGEAWIDIYFDSHDAALAYGVREVEVYKVN